MAMQAAYKIIGSTMLVAVQQAPGVAKVTWSIGTVFLYHLHTGEFDSTLTDASSQLSDRINAGLNAVMTDHRTFLATASTSAFNGPKPPSLAKEIQNFDSKLRMFVLNTAMANNNRRGS